MARPGVPSQFTFSSITPIADSVRFRYPYCALKMNAHSNPFTMGGTAHGSKISARVTREIHTRSSSITSAIPSASTTSSTTDTTANTKVCRSESQNTSSSSSRAKFANPAHGISPLRSCRRLTSCTDKYAAYPMGYAKTTTRQTRAGKFIQNAKTPTRNSDRRVLMARFTSR